MKVRPKKHLGQHFLTDMDVAEKIANTIPKDFPCSKILEIGPGTGVLTQFLLKNYEQELTVCEIDRESVTYLQLYFPLLHNRIISDDFLKMDLKERFTEPFILIGNYPYNISTQIVFKMIENKELIPLMTGMFQKEVAERICAGPNSKIYGITSVLTQAFYDCEYLFTVDEHVFDPPPKVKSGVIRLTRKEDTSLNCDPKLFKTLVKTAFGQRRKTVRNAIKSLTGKNEFEHEFLGKRAENLSYLDFIQLTNDLQAFLDQQEK